MDEKTFLISFDLADDRLDTAAIKGFIKNNPDFTAWWNHLPLIYLVQSRLSADDISEQVERHTRGARFLVMEVNPANSNGWLPERSWTWIKRRDDAAKRPAQQTTNT